MKKVVCPACGLVNLEKFVTFPHCAACGALLLADSAEHVPIWKRPVNAVLWAVIVGICCAALGVAGILTARETQRLEVKTLIVYPQIPRKLRVGRLSQFRLGLDALEAGGAHSRVFEELQLRLPLDVLKEFAFYSVSPVPRRTTVRGNAMYFDFGTVEREQPILIRFRPRRAGTYRITFSLLASSFTPYQWRGVFQVGAALPKQKPLMRIAS